MKIPGLSFSWKRAVGISKIKQKIAKKTGIPTTKKGLERKIGQKVLDILFDKRTRTRTYLRYKQIYSSKVEFSNEVTNEKKA